jgi:HD-GYP domain-containing protein (c-di-GMP phosphodiesterase class II)
VTTRRLFIVILLAQSGCVAVGLTFHQLYISSSVAHAQADDARAGLASQFELLRAELEQQSSSSLQHGEQAWVRTVARWRTAASSNDGLFLLDSQGRVLASADPQARRSPPTDLRKDVHGPLTWLHASADWGRFDEPIRGVIKDADGAQRVALAEGLASHDGYVLLTRSAAAEKVDPALLNGALWAASGITLVWTVGLLAVTLYMLMTYRARRESGPRVHPELEALKQAQALVRTQETVNFGLAKLSDSRDPETGSHLERIAQFSSMLAAALRQRPDFRDRISPSFVQLIGISSALHDIGKVGVEDSILRKPGSLTHDERVRMQRHTEIGAECLREIERRLGSTNFLQMASEIVAAHHEWWNGQGYPHGLAGEQIPLSARIVAVADVYDALRSKRVYKEAMPHEECIAEIAKAAGTQFDPGVVDALMQIEDRFRQLAEQFHIPEEEDTYVSTI